MIEVTGDIVEISSIVGNVQATQEASGNVENPSATGGTSDYTELTNKPKINGFELIGDKTNEELGIDNLTNQDIETLINNFV